MPKEGWIRHPVILAATVRKGRRRTRYEEAHTGQVLTMEDTVSLYLPPPCFTYPRYKEKEIH